MINVYVKALTPNALDGLKSHFKETNTFRQRTLLKAHGVKQTLDLNKSTLVIEYNTLLKKIKFKLGVDYKQGLNNELKTEFIKTVDDFMRGKFVSKKEYEVNFKDDSNE